MMDLARFDEQLLDVVLGWLVHLRAAYSVHSFTSVIPQVLTEPSATAWEQVRREVRDRVHLSDALAHLLERHPSADLALVVQVFRNNWQAGGDRQDLVERLQDVLELLWLKHLPELKPNTPIEDGFCSLYAALHSDDEAVRAQAEARLIALQDHTVMYLFAVHSFGCCGGGPLIRVARLLKKIGSEAAIKQLRAYAEHPGYPQRQAIAGAALNELGIPFVLPEIKEYVCFVCGWPSTLVLGGHCWICGTYVCKDHGVVTDLNKYAIFCSQEHLTEGMRDII